MIPAFAFVYAPGFPRLGLLDLASSGPSSSTAASTVATAIALPSIALHARPGCLTAHAHTAWPPHHVTPWQAASPAEPSSYQDTWAVAKSILSVFHPKNLFLVLAKNLTLQSLLQFNHYMLQLLDHEKKALEAEEEGQPVPDPPPIPDFKPSFNRGLEAAGRELAVSSVRKVYEALTVMRLGLSRALPFLRDYKAWIRDVLAFKHRHDTPLVRYYKYLFATLHGTALHYAADGTVAVILVVRAAMVRRPKRRSDLIVFVLRGTLAQVVVCIIRFGVVAVGSSCTSLVKPGIGTSIGVLIFDVVAITAATPLLTLIAGEQPR